MLSAAYSGAGCPWSRRAASAALASLVLAVATPAMAQQEPAFPKLTGRVVDAANVLPPAVEARLESKLAGLETQSRRQLVVATIPDLQGYEISDYGYRLGRAWGIGDKARNDGALLIVAPKERKVRIEVGYGLEGTLTDGLSWQIINTAIVPRFKAGDMPGGIEAGADAIVTQLTLPPAEAQRVAAEAEAQRADSGQEGGTFQLIFFGVFVLLFFVLPMIRSLFGGGGRRRYRGGSGPIVWVPGGFSGGSGGGGFGGGFGGGGGSFGGGGSSGSW